MRRIKSLLDDDFSRLWSFQEGGWIFITLPVKISHEQMYNKAR
jgi:hypothetical protein